VGSAEAVGSSWRGVFNLGGLKDGCSLVGPIDPDPVSLVSPDSLVGSVDPEIRRSGRRDWLLDATLGRDPWP
jgi:hypothetical protein